MWCIIVLASFAMAFMILVEILGKTSFGHMFFSWILGILLGSALGFYATYDQPTALDVYQGKTTLEITYKDSVSVDSVVVFK